MEEAIAEKNCCDVAIFGVGASAFILQRYYKKEWAENCMMQMMVDNLDAWWEPNCMVSDIRGCSRLLSFTVGNPRQAGTGYMRSIG
jgi:hypothetical protein